MIEFEYKNWEGKVSTRRVEPYRLWLGSTQWHPNPQMLLKALDLDKNEERDFAINDISSESLKKLLDAIMESGPLNERELILMICLAVTTRPWSGVI